MKRLFPYFLFAIVISLVGFIIINRQRWLPAYETITGKEAKPLFSFGVIGDTEGHADLYTAALRQAKDKGASMMLHLGDITEDGSLADFERMIGASKEVQIPIYSAVGNHDIREDGSRKYFRELVNNENLAFDQSGLRFLILDNADRKTGFSDETLRFAEEDFISHPHATYIILYHRPFELPLSAILGDDETKNSTTSNEKFLNAVRGVKVGAIFNGHLHIYLPYTMRGIRTYISGGGGGEPQSALGPLGNQSRHWLYVTVDSRYQLTVEVQPL